MIFPQNLPATRQMMPTIMPDRRMNTRWEDYRPSRPDMADIILLPAMPADVPGLQ